MDSTPEESWAIEGGTIDVYLVNGNRAACDRPNVRPVTRRPIKHAGKWYVRDHGRVPIRGRFYDESRGYYVYYT